MADDELFSECSDYLRTVRYALGRKRKPADPLLTGSELCCIVRQDDVGTATRLCLQAGVPVDSICAKTGNTALGVACYRGFPHTTKILIAAKADICFMSKKHCVLWSAVQARGNDPARGTEEDFLDIVKQLVAAGRNVREWLPQPLDNLKHPKHPAHPILLAAEGSDGPMMEYLLQQKCDPNIRSKTADNTGLFSQLTCLHQAVYYNKLKNVKLLLKAGADTQARCQTEHGSIPLEAIMSTLNMRVATIILRHEKELGIEHRPRPGWSDHNIVLIKKWVEKYHAAGDPDVIKGELMCSFPEDFKGGVPKFRRRNASRQPTLDLGGAFWSEGTTLDKEMLSPAKALVLFKLMGYNGEGLQDLVELTIRASRAQFEEKRQHFKDSTASVLRKTAEKCSNPTCVITHVDMRRCARCSRVAYCEKSCQVSHWLEHKADCKQWSAERKST